MRRIPGRVGRRGAFLLAFGVIFAGIGIDLLYFPFPPAARVGLRLALLVAPVHAWGVVWLATGVVSSVTAFAMRPRHDRWGFLAQIVVTATWACSYVWAAITATVGHQTMLARGLFIGALLYAALACAILVVVGWREPHQGAP